MHRLGLLVATLLLACGAGQTGSSLPLSADAAEGREIFLELSRPRCSQCHILRDANAEGRTGNNLDEAQPSRERTIRVVTRGIGVMESQSGILTPAQIEQLATYIAEVAGRVP